MTTITTEQQQAIADTLATMTLPRGLGTKENACSIAAINLALTGVLTDRIPECMSEVIGKWVINVQDAMPAEMRNSAEWKHLLPLAAGTGRRHEKERLEIILDWMWSGVLPTLQPIADEQGFGEEWRMMLQRRTAAASAAAASAAAASAAAASCAARAAFAPHLNVNGVVDVVAVFVLAFLDASGKVNNHRAAFKITSFRFRDDADDAVCVKTHGQFNGVMLLASSKARTWASG